MTLETIEKIAEITRVISSLEQVVWFASYFIWGVGFYILHQMFRLKFLKILIWSEVAGIGSWVWVNRVFFFRSLLSDENPTQVKMMTLFAIGLVAQLLPLILGTTGAIIALRHLLKIQKEKIANQSIEAIVTTPVD